MNIFIVIVGFRTKLEGIFIDVFETLEIHAQDINEFLGILDLLFIKIALIHKAVLGFFFHFLFFNGHLIDLYH